VDSQHSEERSLREQVQSSERVLDDLQSELRTIELELAQLAERRQQYEVLETACRSLEELESLGAGELFWATEQGAHRLSHARSQIAAFADEVARVEGHRDAALSRIDQQNLELDGLHYDLQDVIQREEARQHEWLVEREQEPLPYRAQVMPWSRGCEEDERFRRSLASSLAASVAVAVLVASIAIPVVKRETVNELPERMAKLVRQERQPPPPPPVQQPEEPDVPQELPEPDPEVVEPPEEVPETIAEPMLAAEPADTKEQVKSKGILAFRDSFASRADLRPSAELGSQARVRAAGEDAVGRSERMMVTTSASGSSGGINLSSISRDLAGGGGAGLEGVEVGRVASAIGGGGGSDRPLAGGSLAGRTDEEIQIVFDRYKAALYRLYNRELRKDPTLRGQMVLRLTIEPDGSVSLCQLHSSDMDAPALAGQVVQRVKTFDFGAKEGIVAMTIIYPIDFLPSA
jgi:hypothetical protein